MLLILKNGFINNKLVLLDQIKSRDRYFLDSGDKIRYFMEAGAVDGDGRLVVDKQRCLNKIGHALHWLEPAFKSVTFGQKVKDVVKDIGFSDPAVAQSILSDYGKDPVYQENQFVAGPASSIIEMLVMEKPSYHLCVDFVELLRPEMVCLSMIGGRESLGRQVTNRTFARIKQIQLSKYHQAPTEAEKEEIELNPVVILHKAIENCQPILQLTPIKRGGTTYQVPIPVTAKRSNFLAMKWLMEESCNKDRKVHFPVKLANELIEAANNTGKVVKKKQDLHRQCEANRAYAHYRWG
nr:EOG090X0CZM [Sida crystallina]